MRMRQRILLTGTFALIGIMNCTSPVGKQLSKFQIPAPASFYAIPDAGAATITLNWAEVAEAESYTVYRSTKDDGYQALASVTGASYVDTGLSSTSDYYYLLVATGDDDKRSTGLKAAMSLSGFPAPKGLICSGTGTNYAILKWGEVHGAEGYRVYRSSDGSSFAELGTSTGNDYTDSTVTYGNDYWYQVSAYGHGVEGKKSVIIQVSPGSDSDGDEDGPTGLTVTARGAHSITLSWNPTGTGNYSIYRSTDGGRTFIGCGGTSDQTVWTDMGDWVDSVNTPLSANTTYLYKVSAWLRYTEEGYWDDEAFSSTISAKTLAQFYGSAIDGGTQHAAAIQNGEVWAWGGNWAGQVGDGTTENRSLPTRVQGLSNIVAVSAGWNHTLALKADGTVWAWGQGGAGQLGDGANVNRYSPVQVSGLSNATAIAAGGEHSLALLSDGTVWAWGSNSSGQLGDGTYFNRATPVQASSLTNVASISAGQSHSLARLTDGTVRSWGGNWSGQLGDGTTNSSATPISPGLTSVSALACGNEHSLAVRSDGTVWAWGNNYIGQIGDGTTTTRYSPVQVLNVSNIKSVSCGDAYSIAVTNSGTVWGWGYNLEGELGDNSTTSRSAPVTISGFSNVESVSCGGQTTYARKNDGSLWAWGAAWSGRFGDGRDYNNSAVPTEVAQPE